MLGKLLANSLLAFELRAHKVAKSTNMQNWQSKAPK
jgi:hypothetical protein